MGRILDRQKLEALGYGLEPERLAIRQAVQGIE